MTRTALLAVTTIVLSSPVTAQHPYQHFTQAIEARFDRTQPIVSYTLRVDGADLRRFSVEMRIRNAPDTIRLAMAKHPEYDDRFWRFVDGLVVSAQGVTVPVVREDSALWRVTRQERDVVVRYAVVLPPPESGRAAWVPFLSPTGGLIGGPHSFMYVVGAELAPAHVTLDIPESWNVATGLVPTSDPRTYFAPTAAVLMDSPIFAGQFRSWRFSVDDVPHRVVYWPTPSAVAFDTVAFVGGIERLVRQAVALFGRPPYREYTFIFQDDSYGGLEHYNSVTLGAGSPQLAADATAHLDETAHEFLHTWNLMRIRPEEYRGLTWRPQEPTGGFWWSEGLTLFYADVLMRRAGLPRSDTTRIGHLESLLGRYLEYPGLGLFSAEAVSRAEYSPSEELGDYVVSSHLQGEIIGTVLDLKIRHETGGRRSMDDAMRLMLDRFGGEVGFSGRGIEGVLEEVCDCDMTPFFDAHIRAGSPIDFDAFLGLLGLRTRVEWLPALTRTGEHAIDLRIRPADMQPGDPIRLVLFEPNSVWGRAGLRGGDVLVSINNQRMDTWPAFRGILSGARLGDTLHFQVRRPTGLFSTTIVMSGYRRPIVHIEEAPATTAAQRALRVQWVRAAS